MDICKSCGVKGVKMQICIFASRLPAQVICVVLQDDFLKLLKYFVILPNLSTFQRIDMQMIQG